MTMFPCKEFRYTGRRAASGVLTWAPRCPSDFAAAAGWGWRMWPYSMGAGWIRGALSAWRGAPGCTLPGLTSTPSTPLARGGGKGYYYVMRDAAPAADLPLDVGRE